MDTTTALSSVATVFAQLGDWVGELVTTISSQPLLLIPIGIFCFGGVIGLAKRLIGA